MFTGIVEHLGTIQAIDDVERGRRFLVEAGTLAEDLRIGDSVSVNGTCLTVVSVDGTEVGFDAIGETLDRTNLADVGPGDGVNLERPMPASGRFDGHIVQGHVDGVGRVRSVAPDGEGSVRMWIDVPAPLRRYVVEKGSITVDGTSLTVSAIDHDGLEIALIPHTLSVTTLGARNPGDGVNLEVDVLAKYVERLLEVGA